MRLVQISDTHFGTEVPAVVRALTDVITSLAPDVVLLCGDITQRARRAQFAAARRFMDGLPATAQRIAVPGNHDVPLFNLWARALAPYAGFERWFGRRESLWTGTGCCVLALDATSPARHKNGYLPPEDLRRSLAEARAACGADGILILAAHQPLWTAWEVDREQTLIGRHQTAQLLADARVDVVLSGHVHVPLIATSAVSAPHLPWRFVLSGSGTALSQRTRDGVPNSFNVMDVDAARGRVAVTRYDFGDGAFWPLALHCTVRGPGGWSEAAPTRRAPA